MSYLLKHQQALHENNTKWNKVIELIREINIRWLSRQEYREKVQEIVKEVFNERK
jgi:hypothetical protein